MKFAIINFISEDIYQLIQSFFRKHLTANDFSSLDTTGVRNPRDENGNLPDLYFLKLSIGSQAVDAGTDIGEDYQGTAPDLGAYEGEYEKQKDGVDVLSSSLMQCYPNPVHSTLNISFDQKLGSNCSIELRNLAGKTIYEMDNVQQKATIDVSNYEAGLYLILLKSDNNMIMHKISIR